MTRLKKPFAIEPGSTLGVIAPAGPVDRVRLREGLRAARAAGFRTVHRDDVFARRGYLAGDDERRAQELMDFVEDPEIAAIVCARGGYGSMRILARLDAAKVRAAAKPLVGFSDATALLLWQLRCAGMVGFHGPMLANGSAKDLGTLFATLRGDAMSEKWRGRAGGGGVARGRLVGGSLSMLVASLGTPWEVSTRGAIVLIEEVGEKPYRIDRMVAQLLAAGKFERVAGIGFGGLTDCCDERYPMPRAEQVLCDGLEALGRPMVTGLPFGHGTVNRAWPLGVRAEIDGDRGVLQILESGVQPRKRARSVAD